MKWITNLIFGKNQKAFWTKGTKMVMWRTSKEKNFWTYLAILKAILDWIQKLNTNLDFRRIFDIPLAQYLISKEFLECIDYISSYSYFPEIGILHLSH